MIRVALAQLNSNDDIQSNLQTILKLIDEACAVKEKPALIVFPENSLFFRVSYDESVEAIELKADIWHSLKEKAKANKVNLHLTTAVRDVDGKVHNASVLIRLNGHLEMIYRKVHLFDISLTDQKPIRESDSFQFGEKAIIFEIDGFKFGSSICYDLRFSELYTQYAKADVDVILVPSAFLVKTGQAHWHVLLRARAIESQCYVLAPAQAGVHKSLRVKDQRETYGHTLAIGPWGEIIAEKIQDCGIVTVEVTKAAIANVRKQIPMKAHRRL